jgi:hypothetical protein
MVQNSECETQTLYFLIEQGKGKILKADPLLKNIAKKWNNSKPGSNFVLKGHVTFENNKLKPSELALAIDGV